MSSRPIGIICALPEERDLLVQWLTDPQQSEVLGRPLVSGRLDGHPVVITESGCGKVAAAVQATVLLDRHDCRALVVSGVAGGLAPELGIADIVIADRLIQHDYGHQTEAGLHPFRPGEPPLGERRQEIAYDLDPALVQKLRQALAGIDFTVPDDLARQGHRRDTQVRVVFGGIVTGDQFINSETTRLRLHDTFSALAVEMEGAAVAQVAAMQQGVPAIVVRSLSDLAGSESHIDFTQFVATVAPMAASVVRRLIAAI
jgi:adenosylhomocysteine nucleosidase